MMMLKTCLRITSHQDISKFKYYDSLSLQRQSFDLQYSNSNSILTLTCLGPHKLIILHPTSCRGWGWGRGRNSWMNSVTLEQSSDLLCGSECKCRKTTLPLEPICASMWIRVRRRSKEKMKMTSDMVKVKEYTFIFMVDACWLGKSSLRVRDRSCYHPPLHKWIG